MCEEHKATKIFYSHNDYHKFDNWCFKNRVSFTMFCDIESFNTESNTQKSFCYNLVIKSNYPDLMEEHEVTYMGKDCGEHLANTIIKFEDKFKKLLKENIIMDEESVTAEPTNCFYCNKQLGEDIVRDHDHFNGKFRGYAHNICNLNSKKPNFVPLYFYNGSKYDIHLFIKELAITKLKMKFKKLLKENIIMDEESVTAEPTNCFYCNKQLGEDIVRDHDHFNGKFRGYAHNICNLNSKKPNFVPLYFYNGSKYDIHLFIKELAITKLKMKAFAKTEEEFFSLDIG